MEDDAMPTVKRPAISGLPEQDALPSGFDGLPEADTAKVPAAPLPPDPSLPHGPDPALIVSEPVPLVPAPDASRSLPPWQVWTEPATPRAIGRGESAARVPDDRKDDPIWPPPNWPQPPTSQPAPAVAQPAPTMAPVTPPPWIAASVPAPAGFTGHRHDAPEEEKMADLQWEYCRVQLDSGMYSQKPAVGRYPYFVRIFIDYYGADVPPTATFGEDTDQIERPSKLWGRVVGQMGLANWEMINVYPGSNKDLSLVNVMAYFKRPVQPGRRVDEPKIVL